MAWRGKRMFSDIAMWWVLHSSARMQYDGDTTNRYLELSPRHKIAAHCSGWIRTVHPVTESADLQPSPVPLVVISAELLGFQKVPSTYVHLCCSINFRNKLVHHLKHHSPRKCSTSTAPSVVVGSGSARRDVRNHPHPPCAFFSEAGQPISGHQ